MKRLHFLATAIILLGAMGFMFSPTSENVVSIEQPKALEIVNSFTAKEKIFQFNHPKREFRSAWITTFTNLDWPSKRGLTSVQQKSEFVNIINHFEKNSINSVIAQVRASSDAFYKSEISPWSEWLTGKQGQAPDNGFDPLQFMLDECHGRNMEFHAWFNPFRAVSHTRFSSVAKDHITNEKPEWFFKYGNSKYYNPGIPEVRAYIIEVVLEVVNNYDVDGVHFDDYFYPYTIKGQVIPDAKQFELYGQGCDNIHDWRRENINLLVREVSMAIKNAKPHVKFGISPLAVWRNKTQDKLGSETASGQSSYDNLYCDTKLWIEEDLVDYMAPQLYGSTKNKYANYNSLIDWWTKNDYNHHLYVGHAIYKLDVKNRRSIGTDELVKQVEISRTKKNINGNIYFRAQAFVKNHQNFQTVLTNSIYKFPALIPAMTWIDSVPPSAPLKLKIKSKENGISLKWKAPKYKALTDSAAYYVVYRYDEKEEVKRGFADKILSIQKSTNFLDSTAVKGIKYNYVITAVDRLHNESEDCSSEIVRQ